MRFGFRKKEKSSVENDPFSIREGRFGMLDNFSYRLNWTEDTFISDSRGRETLGRTFDLKRLYPIGAFLVIFILILLSRAAWLQIYKGDYYYSMAEGNRIRFERLEAKRGIIYDRTGKPIVRNVANFLLYFTPSDLPVDKDELDKILSRIAEILGNDPDEMKDKIARIGRKSLEAYRPLFIADNIEYEKAMQLYLESSGWSGVVLSSKTRREYDPFGSLSLSHILGYTGKINEKELDKFGSEYLPIDYLGKIGVESFWESELKGVHGKKQIEVDALGKEKKIISQTKEEDGHNLVLTVDVLAQKKLEEIMIRTLERMKLSRGVAIVMDPNNGEVIASVSLPAYDNNVFAKGISAKDYGDLINNPDNPLFNRAVSGEYPSGSTIKPVMAAAALEEGVITEKTSFLSSGGLRIGEWFFPDWKAGGHGVTNVRKAIAESVNTFFYYIGGGFQDFIGLGIERIVKYEKMFGLGSQTGVDLPGEASGFLPSKEWKEKTKNEKWYIGDTYHVAIGQGDLTATPLQIAMFTGFFANNGKIYRPHFVREILDSKDNPAKEIKEDPIRENFISDYNIKVVREGMRQTVTAGSARSLSLLPVEAAGKTGTAQWSSKKDPHAWFTGFAPYDYPQIVFTILIEEGREGSTVAVPIAKEFLEWYFGERQKWQ